MKKALLFLTLVFCLSCSRHITPAEIQAEINTLEAVFPHLERALDTAKRSKPELQFIYDRQVERLNFLKDSLRHQ